MRGAPIEQNNILFNNSNANIVRIANIHGSENVFINNVVNENYISYNCSKAAVYFDNTSNFLIQNNSISNNAAHENGTPCWNFGQSVKNCENCGDHQWVNNKKFQVQECLYTDANEMNIT